MHIVRKVKPMIFHAKLKVRPKIMHTLRKVKPMIFHANLKVIPTYN